MVSSFYSLALCSSTTRVVRRSDSEESAEEVAES
jgi:hypothetical protein